MSFMIQGVWKILPEWKIEKFFWSQDIKARKSEERVSVATMLVQYTCTSSFVVRRMHNSQHSAGGAA